MQRRPLSAPEEDHLVAQTFDQRGIEVEGHPEVLDRGEPVGSGARFHDSGRQRVIDLRESRQDSRGRIVDGDQTGIVCAGNAREGEEGGGRRGGEECERDGYGEGEGGRCDGDMSE